MQSNQNLYNIKDIQTLEERYQDVSKIVSRILGEIMGELGIQQHTGKIIDRNYQKKKFTPLLSLECLEQPPIRINKNSWTTETTN